MLSNQISNVTPDVGLLPIEALIDQSNASSLAPPSCSIDESYKYVFLPVCYSLTFVFSLSLNSVVLLRSCGTRRRWNTSLIYMVNLASTDLMYGLSLPFLVASYILRDRWVFGDFMCRLVRFLFYFNLYCSIFFLTCISVHSKRVVKATCALVWVVVFILTCPIFRFAQTGYVRRGGGSMEDWNITGDSSGDEGGYTNCWDDAIDKEFADYVPYGIFLHLLGFFLPFLIIAWCYSQVVLGGEDDRATEGERERTSVSISGSQYSHYIRRRRKSIRTIMTITLLFALCFLPFHVTRTLFLLLRRRGGCTLMKTVSICYKRAERRDHRGGATWWPLKILKKEGGGGGEEDVEAAEKVEQVVVENESKSSRRLLFFDLLLDDVNELPAVVCDQAVVVSPVVFGVFSALPPHFLVQTPDGRRQRGELSGVSEHGAVIPLLVLEHHQVALLNASLLLLLKLLQHLLLHQSSRGYGKLKTYPVQNSRTSAGPEEPSCNRKGLH
ncbi:hypothetical protein F7725_006396 [Dissostichus mawsoni]|uniref:G-protein coupled receptors family 1 profile domain-containing protein n=1 Tax=Dissostichus mawsoni TaxID=36200 RepID=A0A7J5XTT1_DISMA|nr:hypothetical protein F7725_006396 [Dissostichus mawsoni]